MTLHPFSSQRRAKFCRLHAINLAAIILLGLVLLSADGWAGPKLYNMDRLLFEPHPFGAREIVPPAPASSPSPLLLQGTNAGVQKVVVSEADTEVNDPLEPMNRFFFEFNEILTQYFLGPVARGYNAFLPEFVRDGVIKFFANLNAPVVLANDLLQGEFSRAWDTVARAALNSTVGVAGIFDVAERVGFEPHSEDFGQTMGVWGIGEGFYLVLPIFGPSSPRDAVGKLFVDSFVDPLGYYLGNTDQAELSYTRTGLSGLATLAGVIDELGTLRETSVDYYGALRSLYRQRRAAEIRNSNEQTEIPNFDMDSN